MTFEDFGKVALVPAAAAGPLIWEGTVNAGTLIAAGTIVVAVVSAAVWIKADIRQAKDDMSDVKKELDGLRPKVERIGVVVQQLADSKERVDRIERRLENLEGGRRGPQA